MHDRSIANTFDVYIGMLKSQFLVKAMDCPSEEQLIRTALSSIDGIQGMDFEIPERSLTIWHDGDVDPICTKLESLGLGTTLRASEEVSSENVRIGSAPDQTAVLRLLLAINGLMFIVELVAGWVGESTGLLSDSLDMLADALVYGMALWAVGRAHSAQTHAARLSGWFQILLACGLFIEVARSALLGSEPVAPIMMITACVALVANVTCLLALSRHREGGVHMQASWIFSANDVIANIGVILAGLLVYWTSSAIPDLVIGATIGAVVMIGAVRILRLGKN